MKIVATGLFLVLVLTPAPGGSKRDEAKPARDVEVAGIIVDALDRPVPGATVTFSSLDGPPEAREVVLLTFTTDGSGRYAGVAHDWPWSAKVYESANKSGYWPSNGCVAEPGDANLPRVRDGWLRIYRDLPYEEAVHSLFQLQGDALDQYMLEVLASPLWLSAEPFGDTPNIEDVLFVNQDRFRAALRKACANPRVGDGARTFLEFIGELGDPNELRSIKDERRSTPKVEVSAPRLNDAIQAAVGAHHFGGPEIYIDKTVLTPDYRKALVRCHVHRGELADQGFKLRFERVGFTWVLKAFTSPWVS